jgi:hypothetical protein
MIVEPLYLIVDTPRFCKYCLSPGADLQDMEPPFGKSPTNAFFKCETRIVR